VKAGDVKIVIHKECGLFLGKYVIGYLLLAAGVIVFGICTGHKIMRHRKGYDQPLGGIFTPCIGQYLWMDERIMPAALCRVFARYTGDTSDQQTQRKVIRLTLGRTRSTTPCRRLILLPCPQSILMDDRKFLFVSILHIDFPRDTLGTPQINRHNGRSFGLPREGLVQILRAADRYCYLFPVNTR
jgi:hypothetical protein